MPLVIVSVGPGPITALRIDPELQTMMRRSPPLVRGAALFSV